MDHIADQLSSSDVQPYAATKELPVTHRGEVVAIAIVDDSQYERLSKYIWRLERLSGPATPVADMQRGDLWGIQYLDCMCLGVASGLHQAVIHADGSSLNCATANLSLKLLEQLPPIKRYEKSAKPMDMGMRVPKARNVQRPRVPKVMHPKEPKPPRIHKVYIPHPRVSTKTPKAETPNVTPRLRVTYTAGYVPRQHKHLGEQVNSVTRFINRGKYAVGRNGRNNPTSKYLGVCFLRRKTENASKFSASIAFTWKSQAVNLFLMTSHDEHFCAYAYNCAADLVGIHPLKRNKLDEDPLPEMRVQIYNLVRAKLSAKLPEGVMK